MNLSPVEELMLLSAGTAARRASERIGAERLIAVVDWNLLGDSLAGMRLLGTLGPRLVELAGDSVERQFELRVGASLESGRRHGAFLQLIAQRIREMLDAQGIRSTSLKGPLLGEALYGDAGRRSSSDIDLLVGRDQLADAIEVVRELGYALPRDPVDRSGLPLLHFALAHKRGELPPVELHWRIHWYESCFAQERLLEPAGEHLDDWRPAAIDELVALLLFYARDGFLALRHACDIGAWWDVRGSQLQPGQVEQLTLSYPALAPVVRASLAVAEDVIGLPVERLGVAPDSLRARERIARRVTHTRRHRNEAQHYAHMGLIDGLLAPPGGIRAFFGRQLAEPAQREPSCTKPRRARPGISHGARFLFRCCLAMLGLLRPRVSLQAGASLSRPQPK